MGGDGGSKIHRTETVKVKAKAQVADRRNQLLAAWFSCALSKRDLEPPLVADALGKLYNKDALLEFLLAPPPGSDNPVSSRPFGADGILAAGHIRSLKDVQQLKLAPASSTGQDSIGSASNAISGGQVEYGKARWECPITMRGMNGAVRFVYVKGCGCVASEAGLRELAGVNVESPKEPENEGAKLEPRRAICPVCAETLPGAKVEMVTLNPTGKEKEDMATAWKEKVAEDERLKAEKKASKKKKRKDPVNGAEEADKPESKKTKTLRENGQAHPVPSINRKLPSMPEVKKPMSSAIASLYQKQEGRGNLSPFFSGSYSRT